VYDFSVNGRGWFHFTYLEDSGALFFHERDHATIVAMPHDGTGVTYKGNFWDSDCSGKHSRPGWRLRS
jgi:hypothetical protein